MRMVVTYIGQGGSVITDEACSHTGLLQMILRWKRQRKVKKAA